MSNPFAQGPQGPGGQPPYGGQPQQPYGQQPGSPYPQQPPYGGQQPYGQPGMPGQPYPQQGPGWGGMPPMAPPPRRRKKWPFIVGGILAVVVLLIVVGALFKEDAEKAKVGDCVEHVKDGKDDDVKLTKCGGGKDEYIVVGKFDGEDRAKCKTVTTWNADEQISFTLQNDGDGVVLCLNRNPNVEDKDT